MPGHFAVPPNEGAGIAEVTGWRGKTVDPTGFYYLGARYYEPTGGRFLSADPMGHGASISLYDYANGDPINQLDPDGRIGRGIASGYSAVSSAIRDMTGYVGGHVAGYLQSTLSGSFTSYNTSVFRNDPSASSMQLWNNTVSTVQRVVTPLAIVGGPIGWVAGGISAATSFSQGDISSVAFVGLGSIARYSSSITSSSRVMSGGLGGGGLGNYSGTAAKPWTAAKGTASFRGGGLNLAEAPGAVGVRVPGRLTSAEMVSLSKAHGDSEFALVYKIGSGKSGGGGSYWLYSGERGSVTVPYGSDYRYISHTHPNGSPIPSGADMDFMEGLKAIGNPQRSSQILPYNWEPVRFNANGAID